MRAIILPEGFKATLVAAEPDVVQPISYCFDDRGRLFVAEALNYGEWQPPGRDRIVILEDTDGDGRTDFGVYQSGQWTLRLSHDGYAAYTLSFGVE